MDTISKDDATKETIKVTTNILKEYTDKVNDMNDYLELEEIMTNMIEDLRYKVPFTLINGETLKVIEIAKNLIQYEEEFKDFSLTYDKLTWITRHFHDSYFDYDGFENGVKKAMRYTKEYYEE